MSKKHDSMTLFLGSALFMCSPSLTTWSVTLRLALGEEVLLLNEEL